MVFFNIWSVLQWYLRPLIKWFLRKTTGLCELQRICYGDKPGAERTSNVERSLMLSRTKDVKEVVSYLDTIVYQRRFIPSNFPEILNPSVAIVLRVKKINPKLHDLFIVSFRRCLEQIWSYKMLVQDVEEMRKTPYDCMIPDHEEKLLKLWNLLVPNEDLESRVTKQWQYIGFQGDDPKTDFRGMGLLGLENLLFFASEYPQAASHVLSHSHHPKYGYTFAIVGINLTSMAYYLLKDGSAKTYMFNAKQYLPNMNLFHRFYCYLFYEFDKMWIESKPENMMEFSIIFKRFEDSVRTELADPASVFRINIQVDTI
ncbi:ELMO domain-containing protein 2 [Leguminivora glycinivorella]|uniref:ELMO domain-containing protein 2 n=1 Tax=Leguminivora glycinivorella TaxID=1035111 RepID=UPI00200F055B|nr:ELMO domain-containing protein 2 [Leguminivora glycinivorella]